jgi:glycosyltransferase involved in cell wall biosynthesis
MNIVYVSDVDISLENGPGVNEREFVRSLQTEAELRGDKAFLIIPNPSKGLDFKLKNAKYYRPRSIEKPSFSWFNILLVTLRSSKHILKILREFDVDLFVVRLSINSILIPLFLFLYGQRYSIKTLGNVYRFDLHGGNLKGKMVLSVIRKILGVGLKNAIFIDVCTPQLYCNYKDKYGLKNIGIIENPVNIELYNIMDREYCKDKCGLGEFGRVVGYCGGYPSWRGARQLVEISRDLISKFPDCGILIIGEDFELPSLKEKAKNLGTDGNIIFKGIVNYEDLHFYINCMDVGLALDADEKIKFIGNASQKIRQYLACGVPIICPHGTNKCIIDEGLGVEVTPNELDQIYRSICFWFSKSIREREELRIKAFKFARNTFSTKIIFERRYTAWKDAMARG